MTFWSFLNHQQKKYLLSLKKIDCFSSYLDAPSIYFHHHLWENFHRDPNFITFLLRIYPFYKYIFIISQHSSTLTFVLYLKKIYLLVMLLLWTLFILNTVMKKNKKKKQKIWGTVFMLSHAIIRWHNLWCNIKQLECNVMLSFWNGNVKAKQSEKSSS